MIARHLVTACLVYLSLVLQSTVANDLALREIRPWFPGFALVACVLLHDESAGLIWAAILGLAVDSLSTERLGVQVVVATLVAMALSMARRDFQSPGTLLIGVFVAFGTFFWRSASAVTHGLLADQVLDVQRLVLAAFGAAVYSCLISICATGSFQLLKRVLCWRQPASVVPLTNRWAMLTR